jgi:hypothetical protein
MEMDMNTRSDAWKNYEENPIYITIYLGNMCRIDKRYRFP